jgi:hypothetical protein
MSIPSPPLYAKGGPFGMQQTSEGEVESLFRIQLASPSTDKYT